MPQAKQFSGCHARLFLVALVATVPAGGCGRASPPPIAQAAPTPPVAAQPEPARAEAAAHAEPSFSAPLGELPASQQVIARVNGRPITMKQLQEPLIEAYGLSVLLNLVQLEMVKDRVQRMGALVSPEQVQHERVQTLQRLFPDADETEQQMLLEQFLQQQRISNAEFEIVLQTNAHLRKLAEPQVRGKVSEENVEEAFRQQYGETVRVRHIQLSNMTEIAEAKRRLAAGEPFEHVAQAMSRHPRTGPLGGELPPFSRASTGYPQAFRDAAFALKEGQVSDPVQADGAFHLIKLEQRIEPKVVKFEDVKESIREDLEDRLIQATMGQLRGQIGQEALRTLKVEEPTLRQQLAKRLESRDTQIRDQDQLRQEFLRQRERLRQQMEEDGPTNAPDDLLLDPATQPAASPTLQP